MAPRRISTAHAVGFDVDGIEQITRKLSTLGDKTFKKVAVSATRAAHTYIRKEQKKHAPELHGVLKRSIGTKIKTYKFTGIVYGITGVLYRYVEYVAGRKVIPNVYAKVVEFGLRFNPAQPFIRPSIKDRAVIFNKFARRAENRFAALKL